MKGAVALTLLWALGVSAVEPVSWHHGRFEDFAEGKGKGVALGSDGRLRLAPVLLPLAETESERVWDIVTVDGALWIGTGDAGRVYRLEEGDEALLLLDSPEIGIHTLTPAGGRAVYAGTSPDGLIYRISRDGTVKTVARTETRYVWDLAVHGRALLAATGGPARILHIEDGQTETWFESPADRHVRCLVQAEGRWFAGTAVAGKSSGDDGTSRARIYEVDGQRGRLLLETDFEEVMFLVAAGDTLFAAVTTTPSTAEGGDGAEPRSAVLRVEPGGAAFPIWQGPGVFGGLLPPVDGRLTAVLREPGRVLRLRTDGSGFERVAQVDSLAPNSLTPWQDRLVVGDGGSGRLSSLTTALADSGWFDAPVVDLGSHGHWGALEWEAQVPEGSRVQLRTRSGNSSAPDDNWSDWSALVESGAKIESPPARYLQYQLIMHGDGKRGPTVRRVSFTARQTNLPPCIESLTTFAYRGNPQAPGPLPPQPPNGAGNNKQLPQRKSLRLVRWKASDANGDQLRFRIYLRGEGQKVWKLVEEDVDHTSVYWDTETMAEGMTQLRIVASDAGNNPDSWALEDQYTSEPFPIDNSPPGVELSTHRDGDVTVIKASFADRVTPVRGASYSIDYEDHGPRLAPLDGLFDSRQEDAVFRLDSLAPGEHVISVQAWDHLDNVGVARVVVTIE